jgi:hypothetical protein
MGCGGAGPVSKHGGRLRRGASTRGRGGRGSRGTSRSVTGAPPHPHVATVSAPDPSHAVVDANDDALPLASLQGSIASHLDSYENSLAPADPRSLLKDLCAALAERNVSQCITDLPRAPKLLVHASHDPHVVLHPPAANALCSCLLLYARVDTAEKPRPAAARAKAWAATVLSDLVAGVRHDTHTRIPGAPTFPQALLEQAKIAELTTNLARRLDRHVASAQAVYDVCVELAPLVPLMPADQIIPVVESAALAAARMPIPLDASLPSALLPIPPEFAQLFLPLPPASHAPLILQHLRVDAQAAILRLCPPVLDEFLARAYANPSISMMLQSLADQHAACDALALAAAHDLSIHWRLVDDVVGTMTSSTEPFSMRTWKSRWFLRAVHAATIDRIINARDAPNVDPAYIRSVSPLNRRFPPHLRPLVSTLATFGSRGIGVRSSVSGLFAVRDVLSDLAASPGTDGCAILLPLDAHAILLAMESQMQVVIACAAHAVVQRKKACSSVDGRKGAIDALCQVMVAMDCVLLSGSPVESYDEATSRVSCTSKLLENILCECGNAGVETDQWKSIDGRLPDSLLAAVVVGAGEASATCVDMRSDAAWLGEVLRICETVGGHLGDVTEHLGDRAHIFDRAIDRAVRLLRRLAVGGDQQVDAEIALTSRRDGRETIRVSRRRRG